MPLAREFAVVRIQPKRSPDVPDRVWSGPPKRHHQQSSLALRADRGCREPPGLRVTGLPLSDRWIPRSARCLSRSLILRAKCEKAVSAYAETAFRKWCPGPESNRHALRRGILSPLRLPISPPGQTAFEPADWEAEKSRRQPASQRLCRKSFPRASPWTPAADNRVHRPTISPLTGSNT
jgi:hypothetical protein